jgi:hypothetical protein
MGRRHSSRGQGKNPEPRGGPGGWKRLTILGALCAEGIACAMTVAAATTTQVFLAFVERVLLPALRSKPGCLS